MAGRTRMGSAPRGKSSSSRRDQVLAVLAFVVFVAGIVTWILLSRPYTGGSTEAAARSGASGPSSAAAPTSEVVESPAETAPAPEPAPEPAPSASSATPAPQPQTDEQVEQSFISEVASTGLAPPALPEEQIAMARDVCRIMDDGASFAEVVQTLVSIGATAPEADNFARVATASFCTQHSPA